MDYYLGFPGGSEGKESACNVGDLGSIPGSERSPGEGNGNPLQYSCLENSVGTGAWWATVLGVTKIGQVWATNTFTFTMKISKVSKCFNIFQIIKILTLQVYNVLHGFTDSLKVILPHFEQWMVRCRVKYEL